MLELILRRVVLLDGSAGEAHREAEEAGHLDIHQPFGRPQEDIDDVRGVRAEPVRPDELPEDEASSTSDTVLGRRAGGLNLSHDRRASTPGGPVCDPARGRVAVVSGRALESNSPLD